MRIGIRTLFSHEFYLCKVQSYICYQAFFKFTNSLWGEYIKVVWAEWPLVNTQFRIENYKRKR